MLLKAGIRAKKIKFEALIKYLRHSWIGWNEIAVIYLIIFFYLVTWINLDNVTHRKRYSCLQRSVL